MEGGTSWFTDLTVADTTFLLPAMAFGVFLLSAELGGADGMQGQPPHVIQRFKWTMRVLTVVMVPFSKGLPAVRNSLALLPLYTTPPPPPPPQLLQTLTPAAQLACHHLSTGCMT